MGRHAYLMRLGFGRSAFQRPDVEDVPFPLWPIEPDRPALHVFPAGPREVVQFYGVKGYPVSPESKKFESRMQNALNSVIALTGAIEPKSRVVLQHLVTSQVQGDDADGATSLRDKVLTANSFFFTGLERVVFCTYFVSSLGLSAIYQKELAIGAGVLLPGLSTYFCYEIYKECISSQSISYACERLFDHLAFWSVINPDWRRRLRYYEPSLAYSIKSVLDFASAPMWYHAALAQLGFARTTFAPRAAWLPGSAQSPYIPLDIFTGHRSLPMLGMFSGLALSPVMWNAFSDVSKSICSIPDWHPFQSSRQSDDPLSEILQQPSAVRISSDLTMPLPPSNPDETPDTLVQAIEPTIRVVERNPEEGTVILEIEYPVSSSPVESPLENHTHGRYSHHHNTTHDTTDLLSPAARSAIYYNSILLQALKHLPTNFLFANLQAFVYTHRAHLNTLTHLGLATRPLHSYFIDFVRGVASEMTYATTLNLAKNIVLCEVGKYAVHAAICGVCAMYKSFQGKEAERSGLDELRVEGDEVREVEGIE